jgi:hypothetical protein
MPNADTLLLELVTILPIDPAQGASPDELSAALSSVDTAAFLVRWGWKAREVLDASNNPEKHLVNLRMAVGLAAEASSYRAVAKEIGLSARGLQMFVDGASIPRSRTLSKVRAWFRDRGRP